MKSLLAASGQGRYAVNGAAVLCGRDVSLTFTGGTLPHIGAVSLGSYEPVRRSATVSTITVFTHRDDQLAAACAKKAATALTCTVTVSVGIHIDDASPQELEILCKNFEECSNRLIGMIQQRLERNEYS